MTTKYLTVFLIALVLMCPVAGLAKMEANFPNAHPLQPMPTNVSANISHNVNSAITATPSSQFQTPLASPSQNSATATLASSGKSFLSQYGWLLAMVIVLGGVFFSTWWYLTKS